MKRRNVLIVDDRFQARDALRTLLDISPTVTVVAEAANGQEAVQLTEQCRPDVVLMDAHMPGMDGLEATRLIKERWPVCKVIVLTAYAFHRINALAAGADAFLIKGCPPEELLAAILDE
jgi:DNA-binding NarL/FixJ family response regulator